MNRVFWAIKQLLPLTYISRYKEDGKNRLAVWTMWFGRSYHVRVFTLESSWKCDGCVNNKYDESDVAIYRGYHCTKGRWDERGEEEVELPLTDKTSWDDCQAFCNIPTD